MQRQTGTLDISGTPFFYEIAGSGPAVVLLHAGIADSRMWDEQFAALAENFQVLRYDLRGFGRTPMVAGDFAHRHDLRAVLDALHITQAALVGCSISGAVSIDFTLQQIACPILVFIGTLDQPSIVRQSRYIVQQIPQARSLELETAHLPNLEQPAQFTQQLQTFLKHAWQQRGSKASQ